VGVDVGPGAVVVGESVAAPVPCPLTDEAQPAVSMPTITS
jgi:hypothetical protein